MMVGCHGNRNRRWLASLCGIFLCHSALCSFRQSLTGHKHWDLNSGPLHSCLTLLSTEPSPQPLAWKSKERSNNEFSAHFLLFFQPRTHLWNGTTFILCGFSHLNKSNTWTPSEIWQRFASWESPDLVKVMINISHHWAWAQVDFEVGRGDKLVLCAHFYDTNTPTLSVF